MTHTIPARGCTLTRAAVIQPALLLTEWDRLQAAHELHVAADAKLSQAEVCQVCADWEDGSCLSCRNLIDESIELLDLARAILNGGPQ